jgi:D-3-phosphoglycerate dehydrogenase
MTVMAYDPPFAPMDFIVEITTRERLLAEADFITLHLPFDPAKGPAIGRNEITMMKKGVYIINCSRRGGVVDEDALLEGLTTGKVAGAALDVFAHEPPTPTELELLSHPRVSVSPHIGGSTVEAQDRIGAEIALKVLKSFKGDRR